MSSAAADLTAVVRLLVDQPRGVAVEAVDGDGASELRLRVAAEDRGQVIGRRGRTLDALRALLDARGDGEGRAYEIELLED
jgi:predicted RNA-binding protein YlqC (UPF0109 family)